MEPTAMESLRLVTPRIISDRSLKFKKNQEDKDSYMMINVLVSLNCFSCRFLPTIESLKKLSIAHLSFNKNLNTEQKFF